MKKLLSLIIAALLLPSNTFAVNWNDIDFLFEDSNKFKREETQKKINKYYEPVIYKLGILYSYYKIVRFKMSKKSGIENLFNRITGLDKDELHVKFFEESLQSASKLLTEVAWPVSYEAGGSLRKEQIKSMSNILASRFSPEDYFIKRLFFALDLAFPQQTDEFYQNAMKSINEIAEREFNRWGNKNE